MTLDTFRAAAVLYRRGGPDEFAFLGTCFAFQYANYFLTAAHCVRGLAPSDVVVGSSFHAGRWPWQVTHVVRHPEADLAILRVEPDGTQAVHPFHAIGEDSQFGDDIGAIGFPEDTHEGRMEPTARFFRGHVQRYMNHQSSMGYAYRAGELSIGAPAGLSGGPVFKRDSVHHSLVGVVCENFESTTYLRSIAELEENGKSYKETIHTVINYAVCVWLPYYSKWLVGQCNASFR